jgi:hypothetical protein
MSSTRQWLTGRHRRALIRRGRSTVTGSSDAAAWSFGHLLRPAQPACSSSARRKLHSLSSINADPGHRPTVIRVLLPLEPAHGRPASSSLNSDGPATDLNQRPGHPGSRAAIGPEPPNGKRPSTTRRPGHPAHPTPDSADVRERPSSLCVEPGSEGYGPGTRVSPGPLPETETLHAHHDPTKCLVPSTFFIACATQMPLNGR